MSFLEDVFLQDETEEAQQLERVIEGDEFDERPRSLSPENDESAKEDEAEEDKRRVDPKSTTKRVIKNPRFILNPARLTGPRGIQVIPEHFKDFKFKGKGHEKEDLDLVLKRLEHWAYRLYPKFDFKDCLKKIESLGKKRPVMVHLHKIRSDQFISEETVVQKDSSDDEAPQPLPEEDEFDKLLQEQIELARATPAPGSAAKPGFNTPKNMSRSTPTTPMLPKATSSPSLNEEQKERMLKNRRLAEERRLARLRQNKESITTVIQEVTIESDIEHTNAANDKVVTKKHNRSNIIDSSEDENDIVMVNQSVTVDIHDFRHQENVEHNVNGYENHENVANNLSSNINNNDLLHDTNDEIGNVTKNVNEISDNNEQTIEKDIPTDKEIEVNGNENYEYVSNKVVRNINNNDLLHDTNDEIGNVTKNVNEISDNNEQTIEKDIPTDKEIEVNGNENYEYVSNKVVRNINNNDLLHDTNDKIGNVTKNINEILENNEQTIEKDIPTDKEIKENIHSDNIDVNLIGNCISIDNEIIPNESSTYEKDNSKQLLIEQKQNETITKEYNKVNETENNEIVQEMNTNEKGENVIDKSQNIVVDLMDVDFTDEF